MTVDESELVDQVFEALNESAGISATLWRAPGNQLMARLQRSGRTIEVAVHVERGLRPRHLPLLFERLQPSAAGPPPLLATDHMTTPMARELQKRGLQFADRGGNAFLDHGSWFVMITGNKLASRPRGNRRLAPSAWQIAFVLLRDPSAADLPVRELGLRAGVSHGAASKALHTLDERGWLRHLGRAGYPVTDPDSLHRAWEMGYLDRLRPKLLIGRAMYAEGERLQEWCHLAAFGSASGFLGGELAAEQMGLDVVASSASVHVHQWDAPTMRALRLLPASDGPVQVVRTFGTENFDSHQPWRVDPLLVRAELLHHRDERLDACREQLLEKLQRRWRV